MRLMSERSIDQTKLTLEKGFKGQGRNKCRLLICQLLLPREDAVEWHTVAMRVSCEACTGWEEAGTPLPAWGRLTCFPQRDSLLWKWTNRQWGEERRPLNGDIVANVCERKRASAPLPPTTFKAPATASPPFSTTLADYLCGHLVSSITVSNAISHERLLLWTVGE